MKPLTIRFDSNIYNILELVSKKQGISIAEVARKMISEALSSDIPLSGKSETINDSIEPNISLKIDNLGNSIGDQLSSINRRIAELTRIPSFYEFRVRMMADGIKRETEPEKELAQLKAFAMSYMELYGQWPEVSDAMRFGPISEQARAGFEKK